VLLVAALFTGIASDGGSARNGSTTRSETMNANLLVPGGATVRSLDGREPLVLRREPAGTDEMLRLEHLEPGTYVIDWPGRGIGGKHFGGRAAVVMVEAVDTRADDPAARHARAVLVALAYASLLVLAFFAGRRRRPVVDGVLGAGIVAWTISGWSTPDAAGILGALLAATAAGVSLRRRGLYGNSTLLAATLTTLLWPGTAVVALGVLGASAAHVAGIVAAGGSPGRGVRPPAIASAGAFIAVLAVGAWAGHGGITGNWAVRTGGVPDGGLDLVDCVEQDRTDKQLGRECFAALAARIGANEPVEDASAALLELLSEFEKTGGRSDAQCRTAGASMSHAAARWGAGRDDPRALFVDLAPVCDYSSMHGIVAGALAHSDADRFATDVPLLCEASSPDEARLNSPEYSRQCWQAAGIALGRRTRYADPTALLFCQRAAPYGTNNCTDGYFQELVDQKARAAAEPEAQLYPDGTSVLSLCSSLPDDLAGGCYRYVGEEIYYEGGTRREGLLELERVCTEEVPDGHRVPCWYALGMVSVRTLLHGSFDELATPVNETCPNAPTERTLLQCLHGGGNAIIGLLGADAPTERICAWFPAARREEYCGYTERYRDHLREGDPTN